MPLCVVRCTPEPSVQEVIWISNLDIGTYHLTRPLPSICVSPRSLPAAPKVATAYPWPYREARLRNGSPSPLGLCTTALPTS